jgi:hypothetical protein
MAESDPGAVFANVGLCDAASLSTLRAACAETDNPARIFSNGDREVVLAV